MKTYIKPTIKVKKMHTMELILAASLEMGVSNEPATEPAMSKGFFDGGSRTEAQPSSSVNIWEEE